MEDSGQAKPKRRRATRACDFCHRRGLKCRPSEPQSTSCLTCIEYDAECTQTRKLAKRGKKPNLNRSATTPVVTVRFNSHQIPVPVVSEGSSFCESWAARIQERRLGERFRLAVLVDVYFDTVFPIFPFFDEESFRSQWSDPSYPRDRDSYASLMAMLSLCTCHVEDVALFTPVLRLIEQPDVVTSERFLTEAIQSISKDFTDCTQFEYARAYALIALCAIQMSRPSLFHQYLGLYHAIVAQSGLDDESRWPSSLNDLERETWRRLVWSMYRVEVHNACLRDHMIRSTASQLMVAYPTVREEEDQESSPSYDNHWMTGWNFVTDLYQVLEQAWIQYRLKRSPTQVILRASVMPTASSVDILTQLSDIQENLPPRFKQPTEDPIDNNEVRCNFQCVKVACVIQLIKMVSGAVENTTLDGAFQIAQECIRGMAVTPTTYLQAIGPPVLQELAVICPLLSSSLTGQLSSDEGSQLHRLLLSLAEFIESLDKHIITAAQTASNLRQHIQNLKNRLEQQQQTQRSPIHKRRKPPNKNCLHLTAEPSNSFSLPENFIHDLQSLLLKPLGGTAGQVPNRVLISELPAQKAYDRKASRGDESPSGRFG